MCDLLAVQSFICVPVSVTVDIMVWEVVTPAVRFSDPKHQNVPDSEPEHTGKHGARTAELTCNCAVSKKNWILHSSLVMSPVISMCHFWAQVSMTLMTLSGICHQTWENRGHIQLCKQILICQISGVSPDMWLRPFSSSLKQVQVICSETHFLNSTFVYFSSMENMEIATAGPKQLYHTELRT